MTQAGAGQLTGKTLGHYHLTGLLGAGGMAEVYRARDTRLQREVAVKVLPRSLAADPNYVQRFRKEAQRVATLRHPTIVPVYEFGEQDGLLYLVMPLLKESLRDRMGRSDQMRVAEALAIAIQIAEALEIAHEHGIVHRDVKPENVLLDDDGHAMLTDFGIARELAFLKREGNAQTLAATGLPVGTPEYMAPEQLRNVPIDQRVDIYALGAVLYEMLTGRTPHEADSPYEVAALSLHAAIKRPSRLNPHVWLELDDIIMMALARDPEERYHNISAFARALDAMQGGAASGVRYTRPLFPQPGYADFEANTTAEMLIPDAFKASSSSIRRPGAGQPGGGGTSRRAKKPLMRVALGLALLLVIAASSLAVMRAIGPFSATSASLSPTATSEPTTTPLPTSTPVPTATATPIPTATPDESGPPALPEPTATPRPLGTTAAFVRTDTTTQGTWRGKYGSDGYLVFEDPGGYLIPPIVVAGEGEAHHVWAQKTTNPRALQRIEDANQRIAATWYNSKSFTIDVQMTDGKRHQMAMYCVDWDSSIRTETIEILDADTDNVLSTQSLDHFHDGVYIVWKVSGHVTIRVTNTASRSNAVASGLFFD